MRFGQKKWAPARGRHQEDQDHRKGGRRRRDLVLEPLSGHPLRHRILRLCAPARRDRFHAQREVRKGQRDLRPVPVEEARGAGGLQGPAANHRHDPRAAAAIEQLELYSCQQRQSIVDFDGKIYKIAI